MGIRPRRDGEPHRPGGCGALSSPDGGPNRLRDPFRPLSRGGRTLPGGASRRVGARGYFLRSRITDRDRFDERLAPPPALMNPPVVQVVVEGKVDESVAQRLLEEAGIIVAGRHHHSVPAFRTALRRFDRAARHSFWFALCDLDRAPCPSARLRDYLPSPQKKMCFRIAVRSVESWLLADRDGLSRFLEVRPALLPDDPEAAPDPKGAILALARRSRNREVRSGIAPPRGASVRVGRGYTAQMAAFIETHWSPERAAARAPSRRTAPASDAATSSAPERGDEERRQSEGRAAGSSTGSR